MKKVLLHTDDFGYDGKNDSYLLSLVQKKIVTSFSIIATHIQDSLLTRVRNLSKKSPLHCSLHFNIVEGKSVSLPKHTPSLIDKNGHFYPRQQFVVRLFLGKIRQEDIERELYAQYELLTNNGILISTIDSHQHMHALSPVAEVVTLFAKEKKLTIRSFGSVKPQTFQATFMVLFFQLLAYISSLVTKRQLLLPSSWRKTGQPWTVMSWEGTSYDCTKNTSLLHVIHPRLNYDINRSYEKVLR